MALTAPLLWLDGTMVASKDATAPLMGHAVQRGSLVFDVGSFHPTLTKGTALFRAKEHVARFRRSAAIVGLELPFDDAALLAAAIRVVAESKLAEGLVRWSAFYAASEPDLIPRDSSIRIAVAAQALQDAPRVEPLRIAVFDDACKAHPDVLHPETKAAGSYLGPMIARKRAIAAGADDVVLLDRDGDIAEAPIANAFAVIDNVLWTPPLGRILPGITRDSVLVLARGEGLAVQDDEPLTSSAFVGAAEEAFLTSTSLAVGPIGAINDRPLTAPGRITTILMKRIAAAQRGEVHEEWLTPLL